MIGHVRTPEEERQVLQERVDDLNSKLSRGEVEVHDDVFGQIKRFRPLTSDDLGLLVMSPGRNDPRVLVAEGEGKSEEVVCKTISPNGLERELECNRICEIAGIRTFQILGAVKGEDAFLITKKENIVPLSEYNIDSFEKFSYLAREGSYLLKELHDLGIYHGDAKPKNMAISPDKQGLWIYDFEDSIIGEPGSVTIKQSYEEIVFRFLGYMKSTIEVRNMRETGEVGAGWYHAHQKDIEELILDIVDELGLSN